MNHIQSSEHHHSESRENLSRDDPVNTVLRSQMLHRAVRFTESYISGAQESETSLDKISWLNARRSLFVYNRLSRSEERFDLSFVVSMAAENVLEETQQERLRLPNELRLFQPEVLEDFEEYFKVSKKQRS